ncbi:PhzF family phenazine biosynthesis protein [Jiangella sp. DSM 45060]|uniref:PhzF family phenazine biosynthesis protein n=1 Tax=Jiangella sp. DSM 45060 TaxID=1798224 RepID=UPI000879AF6D|nr:PhzF family phenazine biosynthesis protein [Jiangella sp. DSM 45060]SDT47996.1 phenazine biosynthesis protein PhzF family [Jiangella sp. DSM 45060]
MRILVVDAFTDRPFGGNPAGVCLLDRPVPDDWMQSVAAELKHSETAFVEPVEGDEAARATPAVDYRLRWFTPEVEVDLCGHATLATSHVLFERGESGPIRFSTRSGVLTVTRDRSGAVGMDFPALPAQEAPAPGGLAAALGVTPVWTGRSRFDVLAVVESEAVVRELAPDLVALEVVEARGVIVTARADDGSPYDFVSRFFAPAVGVPEDPVTGSAHCVLGPYWAKELGTPDGTALTGAQLSARGGIVGVTMHGDRLELAGRARTVLEGELRGV